ncbi:MAG: hypothetical protein L3J70_05430 [Gammaproteobacteria bacterium]|nr:hypothetical protein [Gammaproteobacteria bacterium]
MKNLNRTTQALILLFAIFASTSVSANWQSSAKQYFENDEYEKVIELVKDHKKDKNDKFALMLATFSHLQEYSYTNTKRDKKQYQGNMELLEDSIATKDLNSLLYFTQLADKPDVAKAAQKLLKQVFKQIEDINDAPLVIEFLDSEDTKTRGIALNAMKRMIAPLRKHVTKGGTLRGKDITIMQDKKLISSLLNHAGDSKAAAILLLIEEPVLAYTPQYDDISVSKLESKISKAIIKREKKYLDSNWYSATGKIKQEAAQ